MSDTRQPTRPPDEGRVLSVETQDGIALSLRYFAAPARRRAVCLCTHAMMANSRYFWAGADHGFVGHLARRGVDTYVLDWRGHGASRVPPERADWCFDDYVMYDVPAAVNAVCQHANIPASELVYLGHSLGGLVALAALGTGTLPALGALALFATSVWLPGARGPRTRRALMKLIDLTSRAIGHAPARALRMGSENEPRSYVEQLTGWARDGVWCSREGVDYLALLWRIETPVWAASGAGDTLCTPADAQVLLRRLRGAGALRRVGRATGDALDADHFNLFTRPVLAPMWDEFIAFMDNTTGAGSRDRTTR